MSACLWVGLGSRGSQGYCWLTDGWSQVPGFLATGLPRVLELVLAIWLVESFLDMDGWGSRGPGYP